MESPLSLFFSHSLIPADRLGDGDRRFGAEGKPAVSADAASQDHPGGVSGAAEKAGVPGVGGQRSSSQRLPRGSQAQVRRMTRTHLKQPRKKRYNFSLLTPLLLVAVSLAELGTGSI